SLAPSLHFTNDPARVIHNADARVLDRNVQSGKMLHAALLLLMLEAVTQDLVSPSDLRPYTRTSFHHQPEAQHPKSSAIHKTPADYPIFGWWFQPVAATHWLNRS